MMNEIRKRPFTRPLFLWITGILLQTFFPDGGWSMILLLYPLLLVLVSFLFVGKHAVFAYDTRWVWGSVFACLLLFLSMQLTGYAEKRMAQPSEPSSFQQMAAGWQEALVKPLEQLRLPAAEKSVLTTLTLGYRKVMDREVRNKFSVAGVAHILSVSGFHVAIVCGFVSLCLSFLLRFRAGKWARYILTMGLLWAFVAITGLDVAAVRAGLMLSLYLTGRILRKTTDGYNTLAAAAFCMLAYNPFYLFDIGFQLSYLAVYFILYLQPRLNGLIEVRNPLLARPWEWITVTVAAQTGTFLLCIYYFGMFPSVFLFTNLPLTLLATLLIPAGLIWMLLPEWIPGYGWLQSFVEELTRGLWWIVDAFSAIPGASLTFHFNLVRLLLSYSLLFSLLIYLRNRRPRCLLVSLLLLLIMLFEQLIGRYMLYEI